MNPTKDERGVAKTRSQPDRRTDILTDGHLTDFYEFFFFNIFMCLNCRHTQEFSHIKDLIYVPTEKIPLKYIDFVHKSNHLSIQMFERNNAHRRMMVISLEPYPPTSGEKNRLCKKIIFGY